MMLRRTSLGAACFLVGILGFRSVCAESPADSTLTVKTSWSFWSGVRKGIYVTGAEEPLFTLGMIPSREPAAFLARRSAKASELYMKHRTKRISSILLGVSGMTVYWAGFYSAVYISPDESEGQMLMIGATVVVMAAWVMHGFGDRDLNESVRVYNQTFSNELR